MIKIFTTILLSLVFAFSSEAKTFSMNHNNISFDAPDGFYPMSAQMIKIKYPKGTPPNNVLTTESTETNIVYDLRARKLPQSEIEMTGKGFEDAYRRVVGGFELKSNKVVNISGQRWIQLEFISNTIDSEVHNIFLVTGYKEQMLVINMNATLKEFEKYESGLRKSIDSIRLK